MQRFQNPALTAAFAACALAAPAWAQEKPHDVGPLVQLRNAEARLAAALEDYETQERNGGPIDASGLVHLDQWAFLPGSEPKGKGLEQVPPPIMDDEVRAEIEPVRSRFRERAVEMASQPVPVRYEDVRELQLIIWDGQLDLAMAELARPAGAEEYAYRTALDAFAKRVRHEVDPADERQAHDAEALLAEFRESLDYDLQRMRGPHQGAGLEQSWLIAAEFRMQVERSRARKASGPSSSGSPDKPWKVWYWSGLTVERQRMQRSSGAQK